MTCDSEQVSVEIKDAVLGEFERLQHKHAALDAAVYNNDYQYRAVATELLNIMTWVPQRLAFGNNHTPDTHLRQSHRGTVADVQRRMDEAEAGSAERREAALELCRLRGLITDADGLESVNEMGETPLLQVRPSSSSSVLACFVKRAQLSVCDLPALL